MSIDSDLIRGHVDTIILKTLASGDKYGYEIIKEIETKSNGTYELKQPTLYSCLKRLESQGFISAYWVNSDIGGKRHYYKLTDLGKAEYDNNMKAWFSSRSIIDNLISEESTTTDQQQSTSENNTFANNSGDVDESNEHTSTEPDESPILRVDEQEPKNYVDNPIAIDKNDDSENIDSDFQNPFAELFNDSADNDFLLGTDEQDLKVVEEYYNTDENQFDLFSSIQERKRNTQLFDEVLTRPETFDSGTSEETDNFENTTVSPENNFGFQSDLIEENKADEITSLDLETKQNVEEFSETKEESYITKSDHKKHSSTKFNFKDYSLNNDNYFSQVKDEVGGSGFDIEDTSSAEDDNISPMFNEMINDNFSSYDNEDENDSDFDSFKSIEEDFETLHRLEESETEKYFNEETTFDNYENNEQEKQEENEDDYLNDNYNSGKLVFGTEEENDEQDINSSTDYYSGDFNGDFGDIPDQEDNDNSYEDDQKDINRYWVDHFPPNNAENEIENYQSPNFTLRDEDALKNNYNYDYDKDEEFSDSRDVAIRETYETPAEDPQNEVANIEYSSHGSLQNDVDYEPIYSDPDATTTLFVDNKRSFVPQYTDNDSKQLLNTLSSYGSIRFSNTNKNGNLPKPVGRSLDELQSSFGDAGIEVRIYAKRPKESPETKSYVLTNKIKMFTSFLSYAAVSFLLVVGYLIAGPMGLTDFTYVPTALPASAYLFFTLGLMLLIPITFLTMFLINKTKKVKPKYSAKIAIIFSLLFAVQCLVIIYVINIPFGLYSFTQIDYNHMLWYLPAICTLYIPIHTIIYTFLYNSKRFHV